jgi:tetratricopeptide (TPR) repeat protein
MVGPTAEERQAAARRHAEDLEQAIRYARNPHARALIEVDKVLASANWRALREHFEAALASPTCDQGTWVEVAPAFGYAAQTLARAERMIVCDPLNFYNHYEAGMTLIELRRPEEAMQAARRGLEVAPDHPFLEIVVVRSLIAQGRLDDALEYAEAITADNRDLATAVALAARGEIDRAQALAEEVIDRSGPWYRNYMVLSLAAITGDRELANETAAWFDGLPGGPLMLSGIVLECGCGAPFDLDATPNFRQRSAEAGMVWPPPIILDYPAMRAARAQD